MYHSVLPGCLLGSQICIEIPPARDSMHIGQASHGVANGCGAGDAWEGRLSNCSAGGDHVWPGNPRPVYRWCGRTGSPGSAILRQRRPVPCPVPPDIHGRATIACSVMRGTITTHASAYNQQNHFTCMTCVLAHIVALPVARPLTCKTRRPPRFR